MQHQNTLNDINLSKYTNMHREVKQKYYHMLTIEEKTNF